MVKNIPIWLGLVFLTLAADAQSLENQQISIRTQKLDCPPGGSGVKNHYLGLVLENKTSDKLRVSFYKATYYGNQCLGCNREKEALVELILEPKELKIGSCSNLDRVLRVFQSSEGGSKRKMTKIDFLNLQTTTIQ